MEELLIAGRFAPRDLLGQGACGTVLEAMDQRLRRLVALKLIRRAGFDPARIAAEAQAAARLVHPNIVTVHDAGDGPDYAWIAMELVIGEPLSALLLRERRLPPPEAGRILLQLLDALGHAHGRGVIHRDVKPANILLTLDGGEGNGQVRLGDFGLAQLGPPDPEETDALYGTPAWMAPEQVRGEPVDHRADLWAAGVVLYEALTGRRPFEGRMSAVLAAIQEKDPPPPSHLVKGLDPEWDGILARALAKSTQARFADASAMSRAIAALLEAREAPGLSPLSRFGLLRGWLSPAA